MRQVFQSLSTGEISLVETPVPSVGKGQVLIKTNISYDNYSANVYS